MNRKTWVSILLAALLCVCLVGCNNSQPASAPQSGGNNELGTAQPGKLIMGTNAEFPPFEFITEEGKGVVGQYDGIDVLIAQEIAKDINAELEVSNMEFDSIIPAITTGKVDIGVAGMTIKPDRLENVDFSNTYWEAVQTIVINKNNKAIDSVASLVGKKVGVVTGYTGDLALSEYGGINLAQYRKGIDAIIDLDNGKLDAVVIDTPTANQLISKFPDLKGVSDDSVFEKEEYAIAVKKGNKALLEKINATLDRLEQEGKIVTFAEEVAGRL